MTVIQTIDQQVAMLETLREQEPFPVWNAYHKSIMALLTVRGAVIDELCHNASVDALCDIRF